MKKAFKYRIYPNKDQRKALFDVFDFCRFLYNSALEERISYYKKFKKSLSFFTQSKSLPEIKSLFPLKIYSQTKQVILKQLDNSFSKFFDGIKNGKKVGFPRYKNRDRFRSICFPQIDIPSGGGIKIISDSKIKIHGIDGNVKIKMHRPMQGIAKQCRVIKQDNKFYISFSCDNVPKNILPKTDQKIGMDLGINNFATLSDGTKFHHPKPYQTAKEKLAFRQRKLALKQKGSNNRRKQKSLVNKTYAKITNITDDFQHRLANKIVKEYDIIVAEDLNIKSMLNDDRRVSNSKIQEASWGKFLEKISYKAESADKMFIKVDPKYTSQRCSSCNKINKQLTLKDRIFQCPHCGYEIDRDINAAVNILTLGSSVAVRLKS